MSVPLLATALCNRLCIRAYIPQTSSMEVTIPSFAPLSHFTFTVFTEFFSEEDTGARTDEGEEE